MLDGRLPLSSQDPSLITCYPDKTPKPDFSSINMAPQARPEMSISIILLESLSLTSCTE